MKRTSWICNSIPSFITKIHNIKQRNCCFVRNIMKVKSSEIIVWHFRKCFYFKFICMFHSLNLDIKVCYVHFYYIFLLHIPFHSSPEQRDVSNLFIMGLLLIIPGASYEILLFMRSLRRLSLICTEVDFLLLSIKNSSTALSSPVIPLHINSISFRLWDTGVKIFKTWSNFLQNSNLLFYISNATLTLLI